MALTDSIDLAAPASLLAAWRGTGIDAERLRRYESWWRAEGMALSATVDRAGTPPLRMHSRNGARIDAIDFPAGYRALLERGYAEGVVADAIDHQSLLPGYALGYVTSFFDPGLYCPYTVSLGTVVPVLKYAPAGVRAEMLERLGRRDATVWQGATWMTEAGGGSDLGANVETVARRDNGGWRLDGEKYFASNAGAELAVVAARPEDAPAGIRGLALFLVPRWREGGGLNYRIRKLKDKIATRSVPTGEIELHGADGWLLGGPGEGIYQIMEVLNVSRVANSIGSAALIQRALAEALAFARERRAFGRAVAEQPLFRAQGAGWQETLRESFALAWAAADELDAVWLETPPYSERYHRFRLLAHLAKYTTAARAVDAARWAMEAHGGNGAIADFGVERLLREAMILSIWEGTPHRQMLDALGVMQRQAAHESLFAWLGEPAGAQEHRDAIEALLARDADAQQAGIQPVFEGLAAWTARQLARYLPYAASPEAGEPQ